MPKGKVPNKKNKTRLKTWIQGMVKKHKNTPGVRTTGGGGKKVPTTSRVKSSTRKRDIETQYKKTTKRTGKKPKSRPQPTTYLPIKERKKRKK